MNNISRIFIRVFIFFVFLFSVAAFSQKPEVKSISLEWEMSKELELSNDVILTYPLIKGNFLDSNGLPSYNMDWTVSDNISNVTHTLENIVYEDVDKAYLGSIPLELIPTDLISEMNISYSKQNRSVSFYLSPLRRKGDIVQKVVSFDLMYELKSISKKVVDVDVISDSPLNTGSWYKFSIDKTGVYKLDKSFLNSIGISTVGLDPRNIRIYGNGGQMLANLNSEFRYDGIQENAIFVNGESDGVFNDEDYILFYGQGAHDWKKATVNSISHRKNIYSENAFYFINVDLGAGKRISEAVEVTEATTDVVTTFKDHLFVEEDKVNLIGAGQQWFGNSFLVTNTNHYSFSLENIDVSTDVYVGVRAVSTSTSSSSLKVTVNDSDLFDLNFAGVSGISKAKAAINHGYLEVDDPSINVSFSYDKNGNAEANAYLDYIEIIGDRLLKSNESQYGFRNFISQQSSKVLEYVITDKSTIDMVWDVSNPIEPKNIMNQSIGDDFHFKATSGELGEYHLLSNTDYYEPKVISTGVVENQNLHGLQDIQYLLVTKKEFMSQAQRLATYHLNNSNLTTKVVSLEQIYNEFGSGSPDITAIRDFVKYLYDNASSEDTRIKHLCLFGDATYDYKDRISGDNVVPVYLAYDSYDLVSSYVTDDYYGMMDEGEGKMGSTDKQDVSTGRILFSNIEQATIAVDKILMYYDTSSYGNWHNSITLATDDLDSESEFVFQEDMDEIAQSISENKPQYNIKKIYSDSYVMQKTSNGNRYPDVNKAIYNSIENGTLIFNYFGHGGETGLAAESILTVPEIKSWTNFKKSPLFITITCDFTRFDNPAKFTGGEEMMVSNIGGTSSLISTTREIFIFYGRSFNELLMPKLLDYDLSNETISESLMRTKNEISPSLSQRFFIFYFGDPAMKLARPKPNVAVTHINGIDVSEPRDTLKALSKINIAGEVRDAAGNILSNYNGDLSTIIYDKPSARKTLNNKGFSDSSGKELILEFDSQENEIFKGKSKVENGIFNFDFIVPKDIKVAHGNAKISLYAFNETGGKGGFDFETVIGGVNEDAVADTEGPIIDMYLDDESFVDGDETTSNPVLIAKFTDISGVNTSSSSIGHSITATIDGDDGNPIQLNEFYEAQSGDFTKGAISYTLRGIEPGEHALKLKVWDTYNNPSDKTLNFTVPESSSFVLENVLNYPNPFVNYTEFWFTHNQPNELLDVKIYIYTVSGKLIKIINEKIQTEGSLSRSISWDGTDEFDVRVEKGVYVYRLAVRNLVTGGTSEKLEKLVLLQ